ncbi:phosphoheptose isomerase [Methylacidiphilum kamchatkense Kam1]|uniref:Phosphoheptose isomerase n=2 Tax=Methylacidiphilum kamchatkense Kam1 TaxID=1202785 RepID=A0A516TL48_9BACT|nr:phosphoheptose isomerase [Methylacidiphilum kamchatkense Kam1]
MEKMSVNSTQIIERELEQLRQLASNMMMDSVDILSRIADKLLECFKKNGKLLCAGNGGSAAQAMHFAEELLGKFRTKRAPLAAISLASDGSTLSCIANDFGFEEIFSRQIEALGYPEDLLILFSTSGNSRNLIKAAQSARNRGMFSIAFLGNGGGELCRQVDLSWIVPSENPSRIQEMHCWAVHALLEIIESWKISI